MCGVRLLCGFNLRTSRQGCSVRETMKRTVTNLYALALRQVSTAMLVQHGVANRSKRLRHRSPGPTHGGKAKLLGRMGKRRWTSALGLPRWLYVGLFLGVGGQPRAARPLSVRVHKPAGAQEPRQEWWGTPTLPGVADEMWVHNRQDLTVPVTVEVHDGFGGSVPDCERFALRLRVLSVVPRAGSEGGADERSVAGSRADTREFVSAANELCTGSGSVVFHVPEADLLACRGSNAWARSGRDHGHFKRHEKDIGERFNASCVNYLEGDLVAANGRAAECGSTEDDANSMNADTSVTIGAGDGAKGRLVSAVSSFVAHQVLSAERVANVSLSLGTVCRRDLPEVHIHMHDILWLQRCLTVCRRHLPEVHLHVHDILWLQRCLSLCAADTCPRCCNSSHSSSSFSSLIR